MFGADSTQVDSQSSRKAKSIKWELGRGRERAGGESVAPVAYAAPCSLTLLCFELPLCLRGTGAVPPALRVTLPLPLVLDAPPGESMSRRIDS